VRQLGRLRRRSIEAAADPSVRERKRHRKHFTSLRLVRCLLGALLRFACRRGRKKQRFVGLRLRLELFRPCGLCAAFAFLFQIGLCLFQRWQGRFGLRPTGAGTSLIGIGRHFRPSRCRFQMRAIKVHFAIRRGGACRRLARRHDFDNHRLRRNGLHAARADIGQAQQQSHMADRGQSDSISGNSLPSDHEDRAQPLTASPRAPTPAASQHCHFYCRPARGGRRKSGPQTSVIYQNKPGRAAAPMWAASSKAKSLPTCQCSGLPASR